MNFLCPFLLSLLYIIVPNPLASSKECQAYENPCLTEHNLVVERSCFRTSLPYNLLDIELPSFSTAEFPPVETPCC